MNLTKIHQIEISTECNLRCKYCPHPKLQREKTNMTLATYKKALEFVRYFNKFGNQDEVALTGMGEAILHPDFGLYVSMLRAVTDQKITLSTNGLAFTEDHAEICAMYGVKVFVSAHRPEKAGYAVELARKHGCYDAANGAAMISAFDWAGQVDYFVSAPATVCKYVTEGWGVVLVDGRISSCCIDANGVQIIGDVFESAPDEIDNTGGSLCASCHMVIPDR